MATVETEIVWVGDSGRAEALFAAISPDDPETFEVEILGNGDGTADLKIIVKGENLRSVRATVDDLLACLAAAESTLNAVSDS